MARPARLSRDLLIVGEACEEVVSSMIGPFDSGLQPDLLITGDGFPETPSSTDERPRNSALSAICSLFSSQRNVLRFESELDGDIVEVFCMKLSRRSVKSQH